MALLLWLILNSICVTNILTAELVKEATNKETRNDNDNSLLVPTASGYVKGINVVDDVQAWLGIPYAEPPKGQLRFKRPIKKADWNFTFEAIKQPNACMQLPDSTFGNFSGSQMWNPNTNISEDCLYLNVYSPRARSSSEKLPVLIWIYGGGFTTGSSALDIYNPNELVKRGNVVFVSFQYRVGAHGFLYLNDPAVPGNVGLLDQDNIENFGGDKTEVTIMGESAGASSVAYHLLSPLSKDLFHRAILQSSAATPRWGFADPKIALNRSETLAELSNCKVDKENIASTIDCLQKLPAETITGNEWKVEDYTVNFFPFVPTIDGYFLETHPKDLIDSVCPEIPVLIGSNKNEGFWSLLYFLTDLMPNRELSDEEMRLNMTSYMGYANSILSFEPKEFRMFTAEVYATRDENIGRDFGLFNALDQIVGQMDFTCDVENFAQKLSENGNNVYRYFYNHRSSADPWPSYSGVKHGDELEFLFGVPLRQSLDHDYSDGEITLSEDIVNYWTTFASRGSPNPSVSNDTDVTITSWWPKYTETTGWRYMELAEGYQGLVGHEDMKNNCSYWTDKDSIDAGKLIAGAIKFVKKAHEMRKQSFPI